MDVKEGVAILLVLVVKRNDAMLLMRFDDTSSLIYCEESGKFYVWVFILCLVFKMIQ